jgi:carbohydrate-selective porin OprB
VLVPFGSPGSKRGFGVFGSVTVAPNSDIQQLPLFIAAGVSARGLFDAGPRDMLSLGVASGYFSDDLRHAQQKGQLPGPQDGHTHETVMELTYRFDFDEGALFIQPDVQYIAQPGGASNLKDALVLGTQIGIDF